MLYIASLLDADDVSMVKLQLRCVLFIRRVSYRKIFTEDLRARNLLLCVCDDNSMIYTGQNQIFMQPSGTCFEKCRYRSSAF